MTSSLESRLQQLDIELPQVSAPVANYLPYVRSGNLLFVSGQLPVADGELLFRGQVGDSVTVEEAQSAARQCLLNLIAQAKAACDGDLEKINRIVKLGGFVSSGPDFRDHAQVINGASDLIYEIFSEQGRHARAAVGCSSLPLGASVEVEAVIELKD